FFDCGDDPRLSFGDNQGFTLSLWVATKSKSGVILSQRSVLSAAPMIDLLVEQGKAKAMVGTDADAVTKLVKVGGSIDDGQWHHVALIRHPEGSLELFVDGASQPAPPGAPPAQVLSGAITTTWRTLGCERYWVVRDNQPAQAYFHVGVDEF